MLPSQSLPGLKTEQVEPAEQNPRFGGGDGKEYNGRGYMLQEQHPRRGDSKAVPLEPRFKGGCTAAQGLPPLRIPPNPESVRGWIPPKLAALDWPHGNKNAAPRGG